MSTRDLIDAIASGDSQGIESAFQTEMASRIAQRLDDMRKTVAQNLFKESVEEEIELTEEQIDEALAEFDQLTEEQLDELSRKTLSNYAKWAQRDKEGHERQHGEMSKTEKQLSDVEWGDSIRHVSDKDTYDKMRSAVGAARRNVQDNMDKVSHKIGKRKQGIHRAISKLAKEEFDLDLNEEQLDELSKSTLASYVTKASGNLSRHAYASGKKYGKDAGASSTHYDLAQRRLGGLRKAAKKLEK